MIILENTIQRLITLLYNYSIKWSIPIFFTDDKRTRLEWFNKRDGKLATII